MNFKHPFIVFIAIFFVCDTCCGAESASLSSKEKENIHMVTATSATPKQDPLLQSVERTNQLLEGVYRLLWGVVSMAFIVELGRAIFWIVFVSGGLAAANEFAVWMIILVVLAMGTLLYYSARDLFDVEVPPSKKS